jgi:hypothetical protein
MEYEFKTLLYDTGLYAGTKILLHSISKHEHNISLSDIVLFALSDYIYEDWINKNVNFNLTEQYQGINKEVEKFIFVGGLSSIGYFIMDEKNRILDNLVAIGGSRVVAYAIDNIKANYK